jgi:hypothetical protein
MKPNRKPQYPVIPSRYVVQMPAKEVKPEARASFNRFMACEDVPKRRVWAVGRFLRDFKVWATRRAQ